MRRDTYRLTAQTPIRARLSGRHINLHTAENSHSQRRDLPILSKLTLRDDRDVFIVPPAYKQISLRRFQQIINLINQFFIKQLAAQ